ncbi:MAG TPA: transcriptional repressor [Kiritimatiellia bacterium]|nr:transcriptional repressor [Kiritimatiellia bacterium]
MQRNTQQRDAIRQALAGAGRPLSPQEILTMARAHVPVLGLATVYRTIKALKEEQLVVAVDVPGEPARYEPSGKAHHHHFLCRTCNRLFELPGCPVHLPKVISSGHEVDGHELTIFGRCNECRTPPRRRPTRRSLARQR